jgi:peptidyl-prolyl cis-trans isomerase C
MKKKYVLTTSAVVVAGVAAFAAITACAEKDKGVAARVNGEIISVDEIKNAYEKNPQIAAQIPFDQFYTKAVDIYVNGKLVYQAAQKADIESTPEYKEQLKTAQEDLARKLYLEKIVNEKVTPEAVEAVYNDTYLKEFKSQKEAKAKHILVDTEAKAKEVIAKLNKGAKFDDLAKQYSKDQADLGYFTANLMVPEFSKAAFSMKKGTFSQKPVKTRFGYHVILLEDIRDSAPLPMKDLEPQIRNALSQKTIAEAFDNLYNESKVTKYDLNGQEVKDEPQAEAKGQTADK